MDNYIDPKDRFSKPTGRITNEQLYDHNIYRKVFTKFSIDDQLRMVQEECGELIQAISKRYRLPADVDVFDNLMEEIADVEIMINQLRAFGMWRFKIDKWKKIKLERLEKLLDE